jgi:hypothetical protein
LYIVVVIKDNYDTLELKSSERLEQFSPYNEIPREMPFFRNVLRVAAMDTIAEIQNDMNGE